jgi:hypothetical protein
MFLSFWCLRFFYRDLSGNQFTGEFPTQFINTMTLQVFNIASNQLQGTIQSNAFENLTQLLTL